MEIDLENKIERLTSTAEYIATQRLLFDNEPHLKKHIQRAIQVAAWDACQTLAFWTGLQSKQSIESGKKIREHWYGATQFAEDILNLPLMEALDIEVIIMHLITKLSWNYTTSEENQVLKHNKQDYSMISKMIIVDDKRFVNCPNFEPLKDMAFAI